MNAGLYIHIPFCIRKCFYCDFYSIENRTLLDEYIKYLLIEIEQKVNNYQLDNLVFDSIYFGGGTPSLLSPMQLDKIINALHKRFNIPENSEITVECNPGTVDEGKFIAYKSASVNRISIGVQSFLNYELNFLKRIHNSQQAKETINSALEAGFENVSIDLMFALPNQKLEDVLYSLEEAHKFPLNHISYYSLIYEEGTPLYDDLKNEKVTQLTEDEESNLYLEIIYNLEKYNFKQYEVSNFAKVNMQCKHNLKYWYKAPYIGLGCSAHSFYDNFRFKNVSDINIYFELLSKNQEPLIFSEELTQKEKIMETVYLSLRADGLILEKFAREFIFDILFELRDTLFSLLLGGFISIDETKIKLTPKGYSVCDEICLRIIKDIEKAMHL